MKSFWNFVKKYPVQSVLGIIILILAIMLGVNTKWVFPRERDRLEKELAKTKTELASATSTLASATNQPAVETNTQVSVVSPTNSVLQPTNAVPAVVPAPATNNSVSAPMQTPVPVVPTNVQETVHLSLGTNLLSQMVEARQLLEHTTAMLNSLIADESRTVEAITNVANHVRCLADRYFGNQSVLGLVLTTNLVTKKTAVAFAQSRARQKGTPQSVYSTIESRLTAEVSAITALKNLCTSVHDTVCPRTEELLRIAEAINFAKANGMQAPEEETKKELERVLSLLEGVSGKIDAMEVALQ